MLRVDQLVHQLRQATCVDDRITACRSIRVFLSRLNLITQNQSDVDSMLINTGILEAIIDTAADHPDGTCDVEIFLCLGMASFGNINASVRIANHPKFIECASLRLQDPNVSSDLKQYVLYPCENIASYSFESHQLLWPLLPVVHRLMSSNETDNWLKRECVILVNNFAYNEYSRPYLRENDFVTPLMTVLMSGDIQLVYPLAAIALSNLLASPSSFNSFPDSLALDLTNHILGFFEASVMSTDYPQNSGMFPVVWKIAMAISNLGETCRYRTFLRERGALPLLNKALERSEDGIEIQYLLRALWSLSK